MVRRLKDHCARWANLPLNLLGRINILKMIYLPKFTYLFRNCPVWLPLSFFREIDSSIDSFLWRGASPRLARQTLQLPVCRGGLALPNFLLYYWAAMLVTVRWWFQQSRANAAVCLEAAMVGSLTELSNLVYRGSSACPLLPAPTVVTLRVWAMARRRFLHPNQRSPFCPLWGNPSLHHLRTVPDPQLWARYGIKLLKDVLQQGSILPFKTLMDRFSLPVWMQFRYYQLSHAIKAQFPLIPNLTMDPVEELLAQEFLDKIMSTLYFTLIHKESPKMEALWNKWKTDFPELDREAWEECFEDSSKLVISSRDKLIQTKFLHRVYYTPQRLHGMFPLRSPNCPRCQSIDGTFLHMFWTCPRLSRFWAEVGEAINIRLQMSIVLTPELALLGIQDEEQRPRYTKILISLLFFYAKKEILLKWTSPLPPTIRSWKNSVNAILPLYKLTYMSRGCPLKYERIWRPWIDPTYSMM